MSEKFEVSATSRRGVEHILATADNATIGKLEVSDRCLEGETIPPAPILSAHRLKTPATWPPANPRESGHRSDGKPEVSGRCFEGETIA